MISYKDAQLIANSYIKDLERDVGEPLQAINTREEPFGWVFFYQTKDYIETGNFSSMLAGNSPFIVDRGDGSLHVLGTVHPVDFYINEYARAHSGIENKP